MNDSLLLPRGRFVAAVRPFPYVHDCYNGKQLHMSMCQGVASGSLVVWGVVLGVAYIDTLQLCGRSPYLCNIRSTSCLGYIIFSFQTV